VPPIPGSYVVTGGGRGVGRAVVQRLLADGGRVVAVELDPQALHWLAGEAHAVSVIGDSGDEAVAERAAEQAERLAPLAGWVNNAAAFRDASLHAASTTTLLELVRANLAPAMAGCAVAVRRFLAAGTAGAIVNVSSHQARRAVPGCLPYVTAKAAIEGLTRAVAVEYGLNGIRANAVALGSIDTERYRQLLDRLGPEAAARVRDEMRRLHPIGRVGRVTEVAATIVHLLGAESGFVTGATVAVDGGRSVLALDPEGH
jgi:NAD(P)-dependent dehydrogenase (short-subunit alcohol dehydrogenase family)